MRLNVNTNLGNVSKLASDSQYEKARFAMANQILIDTEEYVPRKSGNLKRSGHLVDHGRALVYDEPYARKQYTNTSYHHKHGVAHWDKVARNNHINTWINVYRKGLFS